jgi:hypothetical protein
MVEDVVAWLPHSPMLAFDILPSYGRCWRIKLVSTYDPRAYRHTPFSQRGFPTFLSIRGARGLLALNQVLI